LPHPERSLTFGRRETGESKTGRSREELQDHHDSPMSSNTQSSNDEFPRQSAEHVRQMLHAGNSRREILSHLATAGEALAGPGTAVSILILDKDGFLRDGASPSLPSDYLEAIDGLKPDAAVGTCAAAAATGSMVFTPDFCADDKWAELRHLPRALGFVGAWSMPIKSPGGKVLGTFGTYFRSRRSPSLEEQRGVEFLAAAAALALDQP
jgi:GAF domain-containing protein